MKHQKRKEEIIKLLNSKKEYRIDDLYKKFHVSLTTIHRDLNVLEREGRVKKIHGGVLLSVAEDIETRNSIRMRTNIDLKKRIAERAVEFVENEDSLFIDNSTTCYYFAKEISESNFRNLLIVTNSNSIPGLFIKNNNVKVVSTGGVLLRDYNCFIGPIALDTIKRFNGNKFFFSTAAISIDGGLSDVFSSELNEIKKQMKKKSEKSICLVDSTKFGKKGPLTLSFIKEVERIITDKSIEDTVIQKYREHGANITIA